MQFPKSSGKPLSGSRSPSGLPRTSFGGMTQPVVLFSLASSGLFRVSGTARSVSRAGSGSVLSFFASSSVFVPAGSASWMCLFDAAHFEFLIEIFKNFSNADCRTLHYMGPSPALNQPFNCWESLRKDQKSPPGVSSATFILIFQKPKPPLKTEALKEKAFWEHRGHLRVFWHYFVPKALPLKNFHLLVFHLFWEHKSFSFSTGLEPTHPEKHIHLVRKFDLIPWPRGSVQIEWKWSFRRYSRN